MIVFDRMFAGIVSFENLVSLDASNNKITSLPASMLAVDALPNLEYLNLAGNPAGCVFILAFVLARVHDCLCNFVVFRFVLCVGLLRRFFHLRTNICRTSLDISGHGLNGIPPVVLLITTLQVSSIFMLLCLLLCQ